MPDFLPPFIMKLFPSTMSFLYAVDGKMLHNNIGLHDANTKEEWDLIIPNITPQYNWKEYTSTVKNIRMYKGITSTLAIMNHLQGQYTHNSEVDDDPSTHEEWSTISKYMKPTISWEEYVSTIHIIGISNYFLDLSYRRNRDLSKCDTFINMFDENDEYCIPNIEEWVIHKRNLTNLLSTPFALNRDYDTTLNNYPLEPSSITNKTIEEYIKKHISSFYTISSLTGNSLPIVLSHYTDISNVFSLLPYTNISSFTHLITINKSSIS
jgi:hypothetical protein